MRDWRKTAIRSLLTLDYAAVVGSAWYFMNDSPTSGLTVPSLLTGLLLVANAVVEAVANIRRIAANRHHLNPFSGGGGLRSRAVVNAAAVGCAAFAGVLVGKRHRHLRETWLGDLRRDPDECPALTSIRRV